MGNPADVCRIIKVVLIWYLSSLTEKNKGGKKTMSPIKLGACHSYPCGIVHAVSYEISLYFSCLWQL